MTAVIVSIVATGLTCILCPGKIRRGDDDEINDDDSGSEDDDYETGCCCYWGRSHGRSASRDVTVQNSHRMRDDDDDEADAQYMQESGNIQYQALPTEHW